MSKSTSIPSPARSQGIAPRRRVRRTLSAASARSEVSGRLSSVVENFVKEDFVLSPMKRRSVLPDDTTIEAPRRASWWKRLDGSSREVLEALDTNKMTDDLLVEEFEFEVEKDKQNQSVPESSDNESVASIVVPQRRLFNQKKQPQGKFADIMGSRKSLGKTNIDDESIEDVPKTLFNKGPRNRPVFPAALLNSTNKTINKTVEPETNKQTRPTLFGQAGTKRKNMFTDFVLSDSEEDSEVQHKVFGFKKNNSKRISLGTRTRRMPSLTPSMTTEIDIDDWNLLPSSTMIGAQEVSKISVDNIEQVPENQDDTLTEENASLGRDINRSTSVIQDDENDKTRTSENIEDAIKKHDTKTMNQSKISSKTLDRSKTLLNESANRKSSQNKSLARVNAENEEIIEEVVEQQKDNIHQLIRNERLIEEKTAELHGESMQNEESRKIVGSNNSGAGEEAETAMDCSAEQQPNTGHHDSQITSHANQNEDRKQKSEDELEHSNENHESQNHSKEASNSNQDEEMKDASKNNESKEQNPSVEDQENQDHSEEASETKEDMDDDKNESEEEHDPSSMEGDSENGTKEVSHEASQGNQDAHIDIASDREKTEEDVEQSAEDQESENGSKELRQENDDVEQSAEDQESENGSKELSQENDNISQEDKSDKEMEPSAVDQESKNDSKEASNENQDEDMEEMVWNDNDDEKPSDEVAEIVAETEQNDEDEANVKGNDKTEIVVQKEVANKSKNMTNLTNKSHKIVEASIDNDQLEEENEVVDETPNNSTHNTTGRDRKRDTTKVKSPEAVLQNMTNDNESFRPIGRSTTFRKSKSLYETMNRPSLAPVQESTLGSDGSRNSSTEGSEWDSHRTTRKTIRQTLGKEYTTRKSLRALVMEQSAKRQTEIYNKTHLNKTTNKTITGDAKNASKINKSKNKTLLEDASNKNESTIKKTKNKTVTEDVNNKNASKINITKNKTVVEDINTKNASTMNKTKNKTVLEDINDQNVRFRRTSNRNMSSNASPNSEFPVQGTSTHHVPDPLISEQQVSYHKTLHDIKEPEISPQIYREESMSIPDNNDSGPEISMNASYGQGMSADTCDHEASAENEIVEIAKEFATPKGIKEISRRNISKSMRNSEEVLDYEASDDEKSGEEFEPEINQENVEQEDSIHESGQDEEKKDCSNEVEVEQSDNEFEQENEEDSQQEIEVESDKESSEQEDEENSQQEIEAESDNEELEQEESEQEIEMDSDKEDSQQEFESENEESQQELSQQEIGMDSDKEDLQQEAESENEESEQELSQQEIEMNSEKEDSRQEIESENEESQQEITEYEQEEFQQDDPESEQESENEEDNDISQASDPESLPEISREPQTFSDHENNFVSSLSNQSDKRSRVVFDSQMMSVEEIDFEGSRQTNDITEQSELSRSIQQESSRSLAQVSEPSRHEVSIGTKKSMLVMQMQKIAQQNMELRQKIKENVQKSLKPSRNIMSPVPKYSVRRITKEPRQPKKPKLAAVGTERMPKAFMEDLTYKPPKRFQPANAPWITKRLYKFLETKLEPKYDYRARVRAEELVQTIHSFSKLVRRRDVAPSQAVDELKKEMARLRVVNTHYEFYEFFHEFMPREIRIKVNPDVINRIPIPRNGVFGEILQPRAAVVE